MTPQLAALLTRLTCPKCLGNGGLAWRVDVKNFNVGAYVRQHGVPPCAHCDGTGVTPNITILGPSP